jgi:hypothetical protein
VFPPQPPSCPCGVSPLYVSGLGLRIPEGAAPHLSPTEMRSSDLSHRKAMSISFNHQVTLGQGLS